MDESALRTDMIEGIEHQIGEPLGASVLTALQRVPRERFIEDSPYANRASEHGGTRALAPATVARMLTALDADPDDSVLIVGAGIGYTAAALSEIVGAKRVHAIDIDRDAVHLARSNLADAGYDAVLVDRRDGAVGLPEYAPYDRILLEAAVVEPPRPLREQLTDGGRLVYPHGTAIQTIVAVEPEGSEVASAPEGSDVVSEADPEPIVGDTAGSPTVPAGFRLVETAGPARLRPMLVDGEQFGVERNRTRREDAEFAKRGRAAKHGWEREWIDWDAHG
ncbi:protein-L-isoaspartate O-methyltransferase family protein [Halorubrum vacuolatum]|uniref:protein-L-isoaspartate(D-aspartate) O-methyltransferase n=1 Tax=Halorubrum vacuolatum TaxID=63740 RepID=A0A238W827_HALVU|nr:protein-L-isoaspartate O-methyltransferase [Halorubrum vacuolatum]SNR42551.1 protein-L-isoaspartate(D-aspartate) O-methyltransferase [Halorubrum vacuolatum]